MYGLACLSSLQQLQSLDLSGTAVIGKAIECQVATLPALCSLKICSCPVFSPTDLVEMLSWECEAVKAGAADAIAEAAATRGVEACIVLFMAGALDGGLVTLLDSGTEATQRYAAGAIAYLAKNGGELLRSGIVLAGCVPRLVALLSHPLPDVAECAAVALYQIAYDDDDRSDAIVAAGCLPPLAVLLAHPTKYVAEKAAVVIGALACGSSEIKDAIVAAGCLPRLADLLSHPCMSAVQHAAAALVNVAVSSTGSFAGYKAFKRSGALPRLAALLASPPAGAADYFDELRSFVANALPAFRERWALFGRFVERNGRLLLRVREAKRSGPGHGAAVRYSRTK